MKIKQHNQAWRLLFILSGVVVASVVVFYAFIGMLCLHMTQPKPTFSSTCDVIERDNDLLWCKARMNTEDENITVLRGE